MPISFLAAATIASPLPPPLPAASTDTDSGGRVKSDSVLATTTNHNDFHLPATAKNAKAIRYFILMVFLNVLNQTTLSTWSSTGFYIPQNLVIPSVENFGKSVPHSVRKYRQRI